jgi:hypothetical protein
MGTPVFGYAFNVRVFCQPLRRFSYRVDVATNDGRLDIGGFFEMGAHVLGVRTGVARRLSPGSDVSCCLITAGNKSHCI